MAALFQPRDMHLHMDGALGRLVCESLLFDVEVSMCPASGFSGSPPVYRS